MHGPAVFKWLWGKHMPVYLHSFSCCLEYRISIYRFGNVILFLLCFTSGLKKIAAQNQVRLITLDELYSSAKQ